MHKNSRFVQHLHQEFVEIEKFNDYYFFSLIKNMNHYVITLIKYTKETEL